MAKGKTTPPKKERQEVDVFADMMNEGVFIEDGQSTDFGAAFSSTIVSTTSSTRSAQSTSFGERIAQEYGFQPSKEQSFDIPIDFVLDSPYQERDDKSKWTEKQRQEYQRLRKSVREGLNEVFFIAPYPKRPGYFFLTYGGHNRRDAAREEGHTTIPCVFVAYDEQNIEDRERIGFGTTFENEIKIPRTLEERGRLYRRLMADFNLSQEKLGKRLDLTRDFIKDRILVADSDEDVRNLVHDLDAGGGIRIARSLNRLNALAKILKNENAPRVARVEIIAEYRAGRWKVELIEAYIEEILRLAQNNPSRPLDEILDEVFNPKTKVAAREEITVVAPVTSGHITSDAADTAQQDQLELTEWTRLPQVDQITSTLLRPQIERAGTGSAESDRTDAAEYSLRFDKLLKAQKYWDAYRKLADGKHKGDQELSILTAMGESIQEEIVLR